ncbi:MAG: UDP-N-acetylmuramoyl-L-alanine--D-glutamate ligase [Candidatus Dormibacteraeota bacterium]|nr:UDP-N-acetylmuramoyl-L-alanine--D-glutamate ligase [Candidatus Dormibacteraeota bacterium]
MIEFDGRRALVIGYGRSGRAAASYLKRQGAKVTIVDRADTPELRAALVRDGVAGQLGESATPDLDACDLVVVSPGVAWDAPLVEAARQRGIEVTSEMDLFFEVCPCPIAGITGTNGKTTTTALTAEVLRAGGLTVVRGGNIGEPVLDRLDQLRPGDWVVLELSSFQLESIRRPRLRIGAVLNVTPDHLDRHKTMDRYREIKARAVTFMEPEDHAVLNFDDPSCKAMAGQTRGLVLPFAVRNQLESGIQVIDGTISRKDGATVQTVLPVRDVPLPGAHNLSNVMAAVGAGLAAGVATSAIANAVRQFKAVEHRLELVGTYDGVRWYNDSKATNPDSTYKALEAFPEPIVLIAGGRNKGIDVAPLAATIAERVAGLVAMGEMGAELAKLVQRAGLDQVVVASDLRDAVRRAASMARPGSVVLLSPAFTSYDMFRDYEDRGRQFKATVLEELGA